MENTEDMPMDDYIELATRWHDMIMRGWDIDATKNASDFIGVRMMKEDKYDFSILLSPKIPFHIRKKMIIKICENIDMGVMGYGMEE